MVFGLELPESPDGPWEVSRQLAIIVTPSGRYRPNNLPAPGDQTIGDRVLRSARNAINHSYELADPASH